MPPEDDEENIAAEDSLSRMEAKYTSLSADFSLDKIW